MKHKKNNNQHNNIPEAEAGHNEQAHRHPTGRKINKDEEKNRDKTGERFGERWFPYHK